MNNLLRSFALAVPLLAASVLGTTTARAQTGTPRDPYVITSAPYTITKPGYYILGNNLSVPNGSIIIRINASNVTLDFNGFYIAGAFGNTSQNTIGVSAFEQSNLTIKNGTVAYCRYGIDLEGNGQTKTNAVGELIDNMRVTYCYYTGIELGNCPASRVQNCQVSQTGFSGGNYVYAIFSINSGATIQNNTVSTVTGTNSFGIYAAGGFARQNTVSTAYIGVYGGKYQDNLTLGCTYPYTAGTDAGGNN